MQRIRPVDPRQVARGAHGAALEGDASDEGRESIRAFAKTERSVGGVIIVTKKGEYGLFYNTVHILFAMLKQDGSIVSSLSVKELDDSD